MKTFHFDYEKGGKVLEQMTKPSFVGLSLGFAALGSIAFLANILLWAFHQGELTSIPAPVVGLLSCAMLFAMFFPYYLCAWSSRILLRRIRELEERIHASE